MNLIDNGACLLLVMHRYLQSKPGKKSLEFEILLQERSLGVLTGFALQGRRDYFRLALSILEKARSGKSKKVGD